MFKKIVLASGNVGRLEEFSRLFTDLNIEVLPQSQSNTPEYPEPYHTFVKNALAEARHAAKYSALPALVDDSGICTNALNGTPNILSARYVGKSPKSNAANNVELSSDLANKDGEGCYYVYVLVLIRHRSDPQPIIAEGIQRGQWQAEAADTNGFGYDPHFYLAKHGCTAAGLTPETKNAESRHAQVLRELLRKIESLQTKGRLKPSDGLPHVHSHAQTHT